MILDNIFLIPAKITGSLVILSLMLSVLFKFTGLIIFEYIFLILGFILLIPFLVAVFIYHLNPFRIYEWSKK